MIETIAVIWISCSFGVFIGLAVWDMFKGKGDLKMTVKELTLVFSGVALGFNIAILMHVMTTLWNL